jgi:hypothetical protein
VINSYNAAIRDIPMPDRIRALPISPKGYPVPAFVAWFDGVPDFRVVDTPYLVKAVRQKRCWVCGQALGRMYAMTIGPMCAINRCISEPPSHRECSLFSVLACPFLSNPRMRRNENDLPGHVPAAGIGIMRNPGVMAVWVTRGYRPFKDGNGGVLFTFDDPEEVLWFAEGRDATRAEVMASIESGYPLLVQAAEKDGPAAVAALGPQTKRAMQFLPADAPAAANPARQGGMGR